MSAHLEEQDFSSKFDWALWRRLLRYTLPYRGYLVAFIVQAFIAGACEASFNALIKVAIDGVQAHGAAAPLGRYALIYLLITVTLGASVYFFIYFGGRIASGIGHDIRRDGFARLQELELAYFDKRPTGWLISRMTSDCDRFANTLTWGMVDIFWGLAFTLSVAVIMLILNWRLGLLVLGVMPVMAVTCIVVNRRLLHSARDVRKFNSRITASYNEMLMGVATTKTLVREEANLNEFSALSGSMRSAAVRYGIQSAVLWPVLVILGCLGQSLALVRGGGWVLGGTLSVGTLVAFLAYARDFFVPLIEVSRRLNDFQMAQAAAERVMTLIETVPAIKDSPAVLAQRAAVTSDAQTLFSAIEFRHVDFGYTPGQPVLSDFNLNVRAGERIALVGPTGGGKSTIVSLLARFYEPTAGEILFDGVDYRAFPLARLQASLGIVLQTPHLFSGTIGENIRYGRLTATDAEVEAVARLVLVHDFITSLPLGYASPVGPGGVNLSIGQKQLISFARALLADPQIFIIDEATSSVDTPTEHKMQLGLERVMLGRTCFIIAHRLSTIRHADRILLIDEGHIAEAGSHHELINRRGAYYQLYTEQFTEQKETELLALKAEQ